MSSVGEVVTEMEEAVLQIREAVDALKQAGQEAVNMGAIGETELYRLTNGAVSHIEMALSDGHGFLGGNMFTVQDTINELQALEVGGCPECGAGLETTERPGVFDCPAGC